MRCSGYFTFQVYPNWIDLHQYVPTGEWRIHLISFGIDVAFCVVFALVWHFCQLTVNVDDIDHMMVLYQDVHVSLFGFHSWTMLCSTILLIWNHQDSVAVVVFLFISFCLKTPGQIPTHPWWAFGSIWINGSIWTLRFFGCENLTNSSRWKNAIWLRATTGSCWRFDSSFFRIGRMRYLDFNSLLKQQMKVLEERHEWTSSSATVVVSRIAAGGLFHGRSRHFWEYFIPVADP